VRWPRGRYTSPLKMIDQTGSDSKLCRAGEGNLWRASLAWVLLIASAIYFGSIISPPALMDDVDAVQAQIARNMLTSGDWVTARLDGVIYLEKSPLIYWLMALSYKIFGVHDWAARIPVAAACVALVWLTAAFGRWAFGRKTGLLAGLALSTCIGLWLFTRILIPDVMLTFTITLAMWSFLRIFDEAEEHPRRWVYILAASLGVGLLLKSLIAVVFPVATILIFLVITRQLFSGNAWNRLRPAESIAIILLISAPWHVLATIHNPPYFAWTLKSQPGHYHGFLWFYFINEQLLRFLDLRYPHDYNTVPRLWFWLFHLIWLFPWSVYIPGIAGLSFKPVNRAGRSRLLAGLWIGFILIFFTFSTTQEYYSMPCYPAIALLIGTAMATENRPIRLGRPVLGAFCSVLFLAALCILVAVRHVPTPGDITAALSRHPSAYTLSLGHMEDLTLDSFSYLRIPLAIAAFGFLIGALGSLKKGVVSYYATAVMMVVFFQGARLAMVKFDPLLSSRDLAQTINESAPGRIIIDRHYYTFSSIAFYTGRPELLLNGRWNNFEYGSNAPGGPDVFLDDEKLKILWPRAERYYLIARADQLPRFNRLLGESNVRIIKRSGGKVLLANQSSSIADTHPF
jgi:4-amino-4-deoxy-L-arabinose transferase-like glycosyltransferase